MKIKELIKKHWKLPIGIISGFVLSILLVKAVDTIYFDSENVSYSNTNSGLEATQVQGAIDELYTKYTNFYCKDGYGLQHQTEIGYVCGSPICKAVAKESDLHTETCENGSSSNNKYCYADGYYAEGSKGTTTITYGSIWDGVSALKAGDAFDCDINGNGIIDKENGVSIERFYYVSDRWNEGTNINSFDSDTAVLIYYKNFKNGVASDSGAAYATKNDIIAAGYAVTDYDNWHGPVTAVTHLPKTTGTNAWRDDLLTTRERMIYACSGVVCTPSLSTDGGTITPNPFNYGSTTAARLLTMPELAKGCNLTSASSTGSLTTCNFLFEGTKYADSSKANGPWLETPRASTSNFAWFAYTNNRSAYNEYTIGTSIGVRPTIEVHKSSLAPAPPICKAVTSASDLHTETCNRTSGITYCYADGYYAGGSKGTTTITYGSIWDGVSALKAGDAFDCDVNGNGVIDKENGVSIERFYYVSDRWTEGTNVNSFDSNTAVLIYYKNFVNGSPSDSAGIYDSSDNWHGPVTAVTHLPKTTGTNAWRDDLLTTRERTIYACNNENCSTTPVLTTNNGSNTITNPFNYGSTTAARLLTLPEVVKGCKGVNNNKSLSSTGSLTACNFLFERTQYANPSGYPTYNSWLETPNASDSSSVWSPFGDFRYVNVIEVGTANHGVRPVIEVTKSKISH